jgi:gliding motility-associated-like protein
VQNQYLCDFFVGLLPNFAFEMKRTFMMGFLFLNCISYGQTRAQDSLALRSFYTVTEGNNWLDDNNWNTTSLNSWNGISLKANLVWDIILPNNNLRGSISSSDFPTNHALGTVNLSNNRIKGIPNNINAEKLFLSGNSLTFKHLYAYKNQSDLEYANQDSVEMKLTMFAMHRGQLVLETSTDTAVPNIAYQWYKNGQSLSGDTLAILDFDCILPSDAGVYSCKISHPDFPLLTIQRRAITVVVSDDLPNAGSDDRTCQSSQILSGITPSTGVGAWSRITGSGVIANPLNPNTSVSSMTAGNNKFRWTVSHPSCIDEYADVIIKKDTVGEFPFAGADSVICDSTIFMSATSLIYGTGSWTTIKGYANIIQKTNASTKLISLAPGENIFRWNANNGACVSFFDEVTITRVVPITETFAGKDTSLCGTDLFLDALEVKNVFGVWSLVQGVGIIDVAEAGASRIYDLEAGTNTFVWTADNVCAQPINDTVNIVVHPFIYATPGIDTALFFTPTTPLSLVYQRAATGGTGDYAYTWTPDEYLVSPNTASGDFNPPDLGYYTFQLMVSDTFGCSDSVFKIIEVKQAIEIEIPTLFTPNNDGVNDNLILLGIESYPESEFIVMDKLGKLVYEQTAYDNTWSGIGNTGHYSGVQLPADTYFYYLDLGQGVSRIQKGFFVIKR